MSRRALVVDVPWGEVAYRDRCARRSCSDKDYLVGDRRRPRHDDQPLSVLLAGRARRSRTSASTPRRRAARSKRREQARRELRRIRIDTYIGMGFSNLIALVHHPHHGGDAARARHHRHPDLGAGRRGAAADRRRLRLRPVRARHHRHRACWRCRCWPARPPMRSARRSDWPIGLGRKPMDAQGVLRHDRRRDAGRRRHQLRRPSIRSRRCSGAR